MAKKPSNSNKATPMQALDAVKHCVAVGQPIMLLGKPGIGKSAVVKQAANELGRQLIDLRAVLLDPVDVRGLPVPHKNTTKWYPPEFLPRSGEGIFFIDELPQCLPMVQNAFSQLIYDREIGEYKFPAGWQFAAAGNQRQHGAATYEIPSHMRDRFTIIEVEHNTDDWMQWANYSGIDERIVAFLRMREELLCQFDPKQDITPTPRSWDMVSTLIRNQKITDDNITYLAAIVHGTVGTAAAREFIGFLSIIDQIPDIKDIINDPQNTAIPTDVSILHALCVKLARVAERKTIDKIMVYVNRIPVEFAASFIKDLKSSHPIVANAASVRAWERKHPSKVK